MEKKILSGASKFFSGYPIEDNKLSLVYEHNQYWVKFYDEHEENERIFSVVEIEASGFDFEEV